MEPQVIKKLFVAYQRGFDEGHDNDGFTPALREIPALHPETPAVLSDLISNANGAVRDYALWLLEFCEAP